MTKQEAQREAEELAKKLVGLVDDIRFADQKVYVALRDVLDDVWFESVLGDDGHETLGEPFCVAHADAVEGFRVIVASLGRLDMRSEAEVRTWREERFPASEGGD
jgi:hypothetical protein